jgi:hypothetical protein
VAEREADTQHIAHAAYVGAHKGVMLGSDDLGRAATANERGWWGTAGILFATSLVSVGIVAYDEGRRGAHQAARGEALAAIAEAREDIRLAEQKSTLSLRQARAWAQLILANPDPIGAIEHGLNQRFDADGRRSLLVPLWLNAETLQPGMKPVGLPEPAHMPLPKK